MGGEVPGRLPVGVAVAAEVERDDASARQALREPPEAAAVRVDPVQADDGRALRVAPLVALEDQASFPSVVCSASSPWPESR